LLAVLTLRRLNENWLPACPHGAGISVRAVRYQCHGSVTYWQDLPAFWERCTPVPCAGKAYRSRAAAAFLCQPCFMNVPMAVGGWKSLPSWKRQRYYPDCHEWTASAIPWFHLDDDLRYPHENPYSGLPMKNPPALEQLIAALKVLPGVGPKTAQRMAFHLLQRDKTGRTSWRGRWIGR
jgi:hypothetical protein